ncbi:MAG: zf-HC2 domain-containing protein [Syntrophomonadaceae bacterium]|nr:zf-HC2 domain-containing protein [Syntrophomonadaceae bacterium]
MRCEQVRELLSPYVDQMTDAKENNAIIAHLATCPICCEELKKLEAMTGMMHGLYTPQLPDTFALDLRQRLNDEKISILKPKELKTPSKAGWIAAAVAVVALGAGVFTSNYLPVDNIIAFHDNQQTEDKTQKPSMSVEDILNQLNIWDDKEADDVQVDVAENATDTKTPGQDTSVSSSDVEETPAVSAESGSDARIADIYSAQVKVDSTEKAVDKIIQIAQANQAEYDLNAASSIVQAFSAGSSQMVEMKVAPDKVDGIIKELESMGMIAAPMHDETVLTDEYAEALEQIKVLNEKIAAAKANNDEEQLKQLNQDLYTWTSTKSVIDEEIKLATIRVYLVEEIKP